MIRKGNKNPEDFCSGGNMHGSCPGSSGSLGQEPGTCSLMNDQVGDSDMKMLPWRRQVAGELALPGA